jgi:LPS-assembly protein
MRLFTASTLALTAVPHRSLFAHQPVAWAVAVLCASCCGVWAQGITVANEPLPVPDPRLKISPQLSSPKLTPEQQKQLPTIVTGERITGRPELETVIDGQAEITRGDTKINANRIEYYQPDDLAKARGNVRLERDGNIYEGSEAQIKVDSQEGYFLEPKYQLGKIKAQGQASRIDFLDAQRSVARDATYSTCRREPEGGAKPDWVLRASQVRFDGETEVGEASDARLEFKGVPILGAPFLSFPTSDARKSGWLPPSFDLDNVSGLALVLPYYINLAPHRDATIYPGIMTRRGANIGAEFRYLESEYNGSARVDLMPGDRLRSRNRWGLATNHSGSFALPGLVNENASLSLQLNRVSDDDYWRDFPRATSALTQRLLPNDGTVSWARGPFSLSTRVLKWQTLQQTNAVIIPPYDRLPQINGRYTLIAQNGVDYSLELDTTRFQSDRSLTLQPNAQRSYALAQISRSFVTTGSFLTPKLQLHGSAYRFDRSLANGQRSASRILPTLSVDSGLIFERQANYFGRSLTQTLEPRAFYAFTPYRDQSQLPIYDSGANDFNFASVFSENAFNGQDRISDNNLLTLGLSSRLLDPNTGAENLRLSFAQRLRFRDQRVTLPGGAPDNARLSDMLFGANVNWTPQWSADATVQYNPKIRRSQRSTLGARYSPSDYRVISSTYRLNRDVSEQLDLGWQWPLNDLWGDRGQNLGKGQGQGEGRWYSVGRLNYSMRDKKLVDTLVGFEYDAGCWLARVVFERLQTTSNSANKRILFQMEFVGFARVGSNPLSALKNNVPRYQLLREKISNSP